MSEAGDDRILQYLNPEQLEAVKSTEGYVRVIAGAGSGKTRALTHRFAYLIKNLGIAPDNILCITFTNKAAAEMRRRAYRLLGGEMEAFQIYTYHGFCYRVLKEDAIFLCYPQNFTVLDEEDQKAILKEIFTELSLTSRDFSYRRVLEAVERLKQNSQYVGWLADPELLQLKEFMRQTTNTLELVTLKYLYKQRRSFSLDYQDLIQFTLYIYANAPQILDKWQNRLQYIQVDEFQDIDQYQYRLITELSTKHQNLFVVGDPDQTIYGWRGARVRFILDFAEVFPDVKTIYLNHNYRSSPEILQATNSLIQKNKNRLEKELVPNRANSQLPQYFHAKTPQEEANWVAHRIQKLLLAGVKADDIAILFRAHFISRNLEESLVKSHIAYILYNGVDFYSRMEVKDCLAYLKLLVRDDDIAFLRVVNVPARNIGKTRINFLKEYSEQQGVSLWVALRENLEHPLFVKGKAQEFVELISYYRSQVGKLKISVLLDEVLKRTGYEQMYMTNGDTDRLDNIAELKNSIGLYENSAGEEVSLLQYLDEMALFTDRDRKKSEGCVRLMTIHTAKGLEFKHVFVCGINEGIFPSRRTVRQEQMEEERRLAYVAFTRAEEGLYLTEAEGWNFDRSFRYPSRFLFNIAKEFITYENEEALDQEMLREAEEFIARDEQRIGTTVEFMVGDRVVHREFGGGIIEELDKDNETALVKFDQLATSRSINLNFITLEDG